jgi:hypothetical protein
MRERARVTNLRAQRKVGEESAYNRPRFHGVLQLHFVRNVFDLQRAGYLNGQKICECIEWQCMQARKNHSFLALNGSEARQWARARPRLENARLFDAVHDLLHRLAALPQRLKPRNAKSFERANKFTTHAAPSFCPSRKCPAQSSPHGPRRAQATTFESR